MKFKIGITGHSGILGSQVIKSFIGVKFIRFNGDITKKTQIKKWLNKNQIDYIFHFAAVVPTERVNDNYSYAKKVNYLGTKHLVDEIIRGNSIKWFFYSSTSHVYSFSSEKINEKKKPNPISKYGLTKLKAENYIIKKLSNRIPFCIGRIFSFTHKNQSPDFVIPAIISRIKNKNKQIFKNTNHIRDFVSIKDIVTAIKILFKNKSVGIFNIGSGKKVMISDIIKIISKKTNKIYKIEYERKKQTCLVADIKKLKKLNWKPTQNIKNIIYNLI